MRWISAVAGLIATSAAVVVMVSLSHSPSGEATPPPPEAQIEIVDWTTEAPTVAQVIAEPIAELPVSGLDESVSDALISSGYTEFVGETDLGSELDPTVARVLTDEDAVLVIADTDLTPTGGDG